MGEAVMEAGFVAAAVLAPIAAFVWAGRVRGSGSGYMILAATGAGVIVGICFLAVAVGLNPNRALDSAIYPWVLVFAAIGAGIGVTGVLSRLLGSWILPRR
jgi:hypothetical protein